MGGSAGKSKSSSKSRVPAIFRPFVKQGVRTGQGALADLEGLLSTNDLVADFTPQQRLAQLVGTGRAMGAGGFIPQAQETILGAAAGTDLNEFIDQDVIDRLMSGSATALPQDVRDALISGGVSPDVLAAIDTGGRDLMRDAASSIGGFQDQLGTLSQSGAIDPAALDALQSTARGDFLVGGEGFNSAVDAAFRAAAPSVLSAFGRSGGVGGARGGLAETAINEAFADAFASQYGQERGRQIGAAGTLANLGLAERGQTADIIGAGAGLGTARSNIGQALQALGLSEADLLDQAAGRDLTGASVLSQLLESGSDRAFTGATTLAGLGQNERANALNAALSLPELAFADVNALNEIGGDIQGFNQLLINAPIDARLRLLQAALGMAPSMMGQRSSSRQTQIGLSGE